VRVSGPTREAVLAFVADQWGTSDADWYDAHVVERVVGPAPRLTPGTRVRLRRDVERYPHFIAPAGALGTVLDPGEVIYPEDLFLVRMDETIAGAEEWDNAIMWWGEMIIDGNLDRMLAEDLERVEEFAPGFASPVTDEPRTVLMHLNVAVPAGVSMDADEVGDAILGALAVGLEGAPGEMGLLSASAPLVEEV
jgi:hypothetical protein